MHRLCGPGVFSIGLRWERALYLVPHVGMIGVLLLVHFRRHPLSMKQRVGYWPCALVGIAAASLLLSRNIAARPASAVPSGRQLVAALAWVGLAYGVIIGNTIITSTHLLTGSPLAAVATHVIMHGAAVLHGMETTLHVPPHYGL